MHGKSTEENLEEWVGIHIHTVQSALRALLIKWKQVRVLDFQNFYISPAWVSRWLKEIDFTPRWATRGRQNKSDDKIAVAKQDCLDWIAIIVKSFNIPPELVINFDQTGLHLAHASKTTYSSKGAKQVVIRFAKDKRQVTAVLAGSGSGSLLPPQIIFEGKFR